MAAGVTPSSVEGRPFSLSLSIDEEEFCVECPKHETVNDFDAKESTTTFWFKNPYRDNLIQEFQIYINIKTNQEAFLYGRKPIFYFHGINVSKIEDISLDEFDLCCRICSVFLAQTIQATPEHPPVFIDHLGATKEGAVPFTTEVINAFCREDSPLVPTKVLVEGKGTIGKTFHYRNAKGSSRYFHIEPITEGYFDFVPQLKTKVIFSFKKEGK